MVDLTYFFTAAQAVLETVIVALPGYGFSRYGMLDLHALQVISALNMNILTPCLLFTKIVQTTNLGLLVELWIEPLTYFIYTLVGVLFAWTASRCLRLEDCYSRLVAMSIIFSNCNTLPYALIYSIATSPGCRFLLRGPEDDPESLALRGIMYCITFGLYNNILRWSASPFILSMPQDDGTPLPSLNGAEEGDPASDSKLTCTEIPGGGANALLVAGSQLSAYGSVANGWSAREDAQRHNVAANCLRCKGSSPLRALLLRSASVLNSIGEVLRSPPIFSILLGLMVVSIPPLRWLVSNHSSPLHSLWAASVMIADAAIPITIMALGAQLGLPAEPLDIDSRNEGSRACYPAQRGSCDSINGNALLEEDGLETFSSAPSTYLNRPNRFTVILSPENRSLTECDHSESHSSICSRSATANLYNGGSFDTRDPSNTVGPDIRGEDDSSDAEPRHTMVIARRTKTAVSKRDRKLGLAIVLVGRFALVPLVGVVGFTLLKHAMPSVFEQFVEEPILLLVLLVLGSCPPAVNLIMITQSIGILENESAEILMWSYLLAIAVMSLELSAFLWLTHVLTT